MQPTVLSARDKLGWVMSSVFAGLGQFTPLGGAVVRVTVPSPLMTLPEGTGKYWIWTESSVADPVVALPIGSCLCALSCLP